MKRIINQNDVERVSAEVIISYLRRIGMNDMVPDCIDIDDFVAKYLKCNVVIEDIYQSSDCLGYLSYGIKPLRVYRNGSVCELVFPANTIVLDRYLYSSGQETKRRFTLAHEAGHFITNRINNRSYAEACYHENDGIAVRTKQDLVNRFSMDEYFANRFASCLLMPAQTVKKYIRAYFDRDKVPLDEHGTLNTYDQALLREIADKLNVSMTSFIYRLNELQLYDIYCGNGMQS